MPPNFGVNTPASSCWTRVHARSGAGASAAVELASILSSDLADGSPLVSVGPASVTLDGAAVADDLYLRNPSLLRGARLAITLRGETLESRVGVAEYDPETRELRLEVAEGGAHRALLDADAVLELRPRILMDSVEFQIAPDGLDGGPDLSRASAWTNELPRGARHLRYRMPLAPRADDAPQKVETPVPALDFLRARLGF
jgi:hypothetical protein